MFEAKGTTTPGRPWHLWLIGIIGGLWSAMGVVSFLLTQMKVEAVMSRFPPQQRAYFESFPWWVVAFWAISVFGGVIGCLLLQFLAGYFLGRREARGDPAGPAGTV